MILPKVTIKKILYATDLSPNARYAFAYAVSLANHYNATITMLHVLDEHPGIEASVISYIGEEQWAEIQRKHENEARQILIGKQKEDQSVMKDILDRFFQDAREEFENQSFVVDEILVKRGLPVDQIIQQAEETNCDLIVMGTRGHGTLTDVMLGSTAQKVLKRCKKNVLAVQIP